MPPLAAAFLLARLLQPAAAGLLNAESVSDPANAQGVKCSLDNEFLCSDSPFAERPCEQFGSTNWTLPILHKYLEAAIAVEFFTIPLYLTAGYSLTEQIEEPKADGSSATVTAFGRYVDTDSKKVMPINNSFTPYKLIKATFVDEMFHLNWVANVASAAGLDADGFRRALKKPPLANGTYLDQLPVRLSSNNLTYSGSGALDSVITTMLAIETPDPEHAPNPDFEYGVAPPPPPPQSQEPTDHCPKLDGTGKVKAGAYRSISDFYYALWEGLIALKSKIQWPKDGNRQFIFGAHAGQDLKAVTNVTTALGNILAIVYEGEGADVRIMSGARVMTERGILPREYVTAGDEVDSTDVAAYTHYDRFLAINKWVESLPPDNKTKYIKSLERHCDRNGECQSAAMKANLQQADAYNNLLKDIVDGYSNETKNSLPKSQWFAHMAYAPMSVQSTTMALEAGPMPKGSKTSCPYANPLWLTSS